MMVQKKEEDERDMREELRKWKAKSGEGRGKRE